MIRLTRREALLAGAAAAGAVALPHPGAAGEGETETHGLSSFGELKYPAEFRHFDYVDPQAPKGGTLAVQIKQTIGNQNFDTFNTLNHFVLKGDGAAGMGLTYDTLMTGSPAFVVAGSVSALMTGLGDEPDALYGLLARSVRISADKLTYRFVLRPEARFHDGSKVTARDVAFSLMALKAKGHPSFRVVLTELAGAEPEGDEVVRVTLSPKRSRDLHLIVAGLPVFSAAWWEGRDFEASILEAPLGSGPYRVGRFDPGRFIEFERVPDYWGRDLPVAVGQNNFDRIRYEYFRDRTVAFEAFKNGTLNFHEEYTSRFWATNYDFPAVREGRVRREEIPVDLPATVQGWHFNLRREPFRDPRVREAIGLAFDFEWTNQNIMYGSFRRTTSYFDNSDMKATGLPSGEELALLEPFRDRLPAAAFREPPVPPVSDGSGQDRRLLRRADELLREAGCRREGGVLRLPSGKPFEIEFLDVSPALQPHTQPFQANLKRLGIEARSRIVDPAQYQRRMDEFDFDMASRNMGGSLTPGIELRGVYGSEAARTPGSRNISGIADPAVDALIERIGQAATRAELTVACRALDRVLRVGHYWVPMWYRSSEWLAYWDMFSRPEARPRYASGAPGTWWYDDAKARRIGRAG